MHRLYSPMLMDSGDSVQHSLSNYPLYVSVWMLYVLLLSFSKWSLFSTNILKIGFWNLFICIVGNGYVIALLWGWCTLWLLLHRTWNPKATADLQLILKFSFMLPNFIQFHMCCLFIFTEYFSYVQQAIHLQVVIENAISLVVCMVLSPQISHEAFLFWSFLHDALMGFLYCVIIVLSSFH